MGWPVAKEYTQQRHAGLKAPPLALAIPTGGADCCVQALERWDDQGEHDKGPIGKLCDACAGARHGPHEQATQTDGCGLEHNQQRV